MDAAGPDRAGSGMMSVPGAGAPSRPGADRVLLIAALILLAAGATTLWLLGDRLWLLPTVCPVRALTGLYCPGCGSTRAASALLHGDLVEAFGHNPLAVVFTPVVVYAGLKQAARMATGRSIPRRHIPARYIWGLLGLMVAYAVLRNLPWGPFTLLAP